MTFYPIYDTQEESMNNLEYNLEKYAELTVTTGINLKKGQTLVIMAPIDASPFARLCAKKAYEAGAKDVVVHYNDEQLSRIKFDHAQMDVFEDVPAWFADSRNHYAKIGAAFLSIHASDPNVFSGVDPKKLAVSNIAQRKAMHPYRNALDEGKIAWCIVSVPTPAWAKKVFPDLAQEEAIDTLWNAIFKATRVNTEDPKASWKQHKMQIDQRRGFLNEKQFVSFRYQNSLGTDLTVGLPENHIFEGAGATTIYGTPFIPNMPTEEIFSMPHRDKVEGKIYASMPLNYQGTLVKDFWFSFHEGRIVDFGAKEGYEALKNLIDTDEGAHYLGEIALVANDSPISNMGILFYNTLYDENASCHFAIGKCYPTCIENGLSYSREELLKKGGNDSLEHVDFMVGTKDLRITATTKEGEQVDIFLDGNWVI